MSEISKCEHIWLRKAGIDSLTVCLLCGAHPWMCPCSALALHEEPPAH